MGVANTSEACGFDMRATLICHDPNFGFVTKVRAWKGVGQECNLKVTFKCP
jgi:hypothetical protein